MQQAHPFDRMQEPTMTGGLGWIWKRITGMFLAGVLILLPLVVTIGAVVWGVDFLIGFVGPGTQVGKGLSRLGLSVRPESHVPYLIGWLILLVVIFLLGAAIEAGARRVLVRISDAFFSRIPLIGSLYGTTKQMVDLFNTGDNDAIRGMSPVFCFFGGGGECGLLAFLVSPERVKVQGREYQMVIIPTAPVPFGGALLFVPADNIVPAEMSVDAMMSIYLSMGISAPEHMATATPSSSAAATAHDAP
jgi:uncharacterized membrane protein